MSTGIYKREEWMKTGKNPNSLSNLKPTLKHTKETKKKISEANYKRFSKGEEFHPRWKGNEVGYRTLHKWVEKHLGKPHYCEQCKNTKLKHRQYHWANISGLYFRDVSDWMRLCVRCHKFYDKKYV